MIPLVVPPILYPNDAIIMLSHHPSFLSLLSSSIPSLSFSFFLFYIIKLYILIHTYIFCFTLVYCIYVCVLYVCMTISRRVRTSNLTLCSSLSLSLPYLFCTNVHLFCVHHFIPQKHLISAPRNFYFLVYSSCLLFFSFLFFFFFFSLSILF